MYSDTRRTNTESNIYDTVPRLEFLNALTLESETPKKVCWKYQALHITNVQSKDMELSLHEFTAVFTSCLFWHNLLPVLYNSLMATDRDYKLEL